MKNKYAILLVLLGLILGSVIGAIGFSTHTTTVKTVNVTQEVEVPVVKKVEVVKIVNNTIVDNSLVESLQHKNSLLISKLERVTGEEVNLEDLESENNYLIVGINDFKKDYFYKLLWKDYKLSDISIVKIYNEEAKVSDVNRIINGVSKEVTIASVSFDLKVNYEDNDKFDYRYYNIVMNYDYDFDGDLNVEVEINHI